MIFAPWIKRAQKKIQEELIRRQHESTQAMSQEELIRRLSPERKREYYVLHEKIKNLEKHKFRSRDISKLKGELNKLLHRPYIWVRCALIELLKYVA